jgi:hypothetical protein
MKVTDTQNTDAAILTRVIQPLRDDLPPAAARALLKLAFTPEDRERMHQLVVKNQSDALSKREEHELASYRRVARILDLIAARARLSLSRHNRGT